MSERWLRAVISAAVLLVLVKESWAWGGCGETQPTWDRAPGANAAPALKEQSDFWFFTQDFMFTCGVRKLNNDQNWTKPCCKIPACPKVSGHLIMMVVDVWLHSFGLSFSSRCWSCFMDFLSIRNKSISDVQHWCCGLLFCSFKISLKPLKS